MPKGGSVIRGNLVSKTIRGLVMKLDYDLANQLTQTTQGGDGLSVPTSVSFQYDQAGRLLTEQSTLTPQLSTKSYSYGYLDKVRAVKVNGVTTASYTYDATGMLVYKTKATVDAENTQLTSANKKQKAKFEIGQAYLWDGIALVSQGQEKYSNESHLTGGLPLVSKTIVEQDNEIINHKSKIINDFDYLGTSLWSEEQKATKESGSTPISHSLTSYGESPTTSNRATFAQTSSTAQTLNLKSPTLNENARFTGKPYDADLGAYVFPFRNYRPELARWTSADPAGFPDGPNGHFYAPVPGIGVDPYGLVFEFLPVLGTLEQGLKTIFGAYPGMKSSDYSVKNHEDPFCHNEIDAQIISFTLSLITPNAIRVGIEYGITVVSSYLAIPQVALPAAAISVIDTLVSSVLTVWGSDKIKSAGLEAEMKLCE
jgi:RHS repeat-associated protein